MSDNWISLIPEDPRRVPPRDRQQRAKQRLAQVAPDADQVEAKEWDSVQFVDCGGNFERVRCPSCRSDISQEWWGDRMAEDSDSGFQLAKYSTPCCGTKLGLDELVYEWPQGFARFVLEAMNPDLGKLSDEVREELEGILGTRLRVIYRHL